MPTVERTLELPSWHWTHDQGQNGACVGHGSAMERAIRQRYEGKYLKRLPRYTVRFDPWFIWDNAKKIDEWPDTNPGDDNGTSVRAGYDVLRDRGAPRIGLQSEGDYQGPYNHGDKPTDPTAKVDVNTWATTIDEMRACIYRYQPVTIGINWYSNFDTPTTHHDGTHWIGEGDLGSVEGGHCICIYGASDRRQAFRVKNSWGESYPLVWLPYATMERLLSEDGEATVAVDSLL